MRVLAIALPAVAIVWNARAMYAQTTAVVRADPVGDAVVRRTDTGGDGLIDAVAHRLPDVITYAIGPWQPSAPQGDIFVGEWAPAGEFFRLDLVLAGLVNPPGTLGHGFPYDPYRYGPNPVFGYVEIDMDADVDTGGELDQPELRYLGNAARFGGLPADPRYAGRAALGQAAFDGAFNTPPFIERSGEEFHIAFHGWQIDEVIRSNQVSTTFGPGDTWTLVGRLFHRAHAYERFSYACCTPNLGSYEPVVRLRFSHDIATDRTRISLVYPLTNHASALTGGQGAVEPLDGNASNQNSVLEALDDLIFSVNNAAAVWTTDPAYAVISRWGGKNADSFLDPARWRITVLLGTSYMVASEEALFVWTDIAPNVLRGDFDGSGTVDAADRVRFDNHMAFADGRVGWDEDGVVDGRVDLPGFGWNFSVFDVNYDGLIDVTDRPTPVFPGDFDDDNDVDLADFGGFQACFNGPNRPHAKSGCGDGDFDRDGDVDLTDFGVFQACFNGPNRRPACE